MTTTNTSSETAQKSRRSFQFSLRTLLAIMLVCVIGLSWIAYQRRESQQAWRVVHAVLEGQLAFLDGQQSVPTTGNWLQRKLGMDFPNAPTFAAIYNQPSIEKAVEQLRQIPSLTSVSIVRCSGPIDEEIAPLATLPHLQELNIRQSTFTGAGLKHFATCRNLASVGLTGQDTLTATGLSSLANLPSLRTLDLSQSLIRRSELQVVSQARNLRELSLSETWVGDAVTEPLQKMPLLEKLNLYNTNVSDTGLRSMAKIASLKDINIVGTKVTRKGAEELNQAKPGILIFGP